MHWRSSPRAEFAAGVAADFPHLAALTAAIRSSPPEGPQLCPMARAWIRRTVVCMTQPTTPHVLIVGGGVAALEALIALRDLAGDRVRITLLAPETDFTYRPMTVAEPFPLGHARAYPLAEITDELRRRASSRTASPRCGRRRRRSVARAARDVAYDYLVIAVGAKARPRFPHAITFGDDPSEEQLHGMLADLEDGYLAARRVRRPERGDVDPAALRARADDRTPGLEHGHRRIRFIARHARGARRSRCSGRRRATPSPSCSTTTAIDFVGALVPERRARLRDRDPGGRRIDADRVVALPGSWGVALAGVPADGDGFIPVDAHGRVPGLPGVFAAGDATTSRSSRAASPPSRPTPWPRRSRPRPARRWSPSRSARCCEDCCSPAATTASSASGRRRRGRGRGRGAPLWWPPSKIAGRYLAPYLSAATTVRSSRPSERSSAPVEIPLSPRTTAGHS